MSAFLSPPVDVTPAMSVGDECRECAHFATKRLGMAQREKSCLHRVQNKGTWTSTYRTDNLKACSLHCLLNELRAAGETANAVLLRLTPEERTRLRDYGVRMLDLQATPPAKRARLA